MVDVMVVRKVALPVSLALVAVLQCACAATHEEPPAPPPPPVDTAAFNAPARPPAQSVDLSRDLDGGDPFPDAVAPAMLMDAAPTATVDAATTTATSTTPATKSSKTKKP